MASIKMRGADGKEAGSVELPDAVFGAEINVHVMHRVVVAQRAAARAGTASTKTRGQVRGGGKKPWRQKGTGRARQGSIRAPQWTGGGVVWGPHPRDYDVRVNKKEKLIALRSALSDRHSAGNLHVLKEITFDAPKTRQAVELLDGLELRERKVLLVLEGSEDAVIKSFRNIPNVHLLESGQLNTYDVLYSDAVVFTRASLDAFLGRVAGQPEDDELVLETAAPAEKPKAKAKPTAKAESKAETEPKAGKPAEDTENGSDGKEDA
jgi:large subunit ribosomal protein L4